MSLEPKAAAKATALVVGMALYVAAIVVAGTLDMIWLVMALVFVPMGPLLIYGFWVTVYDNMKEKP